MFIEIVLVLILLLLLIIASQNSSRGGMQNNNLNIIINKLSHIHMQLDILNRDNNFNKSNVSKAEEIKE
jgi:hypothetical protein